MKKTVKLISLAAVASAAALGLASCGEDKTAATTTNEVPTVTDTTTTTTTTVTDTEVTVSGLQVEGAQDTFLVGQTCKAGDGIAVKAVMSDGTTQAVTDYKVDYSGVDKTKAGEYDVKVTYGDVSASYGVTYVEIKEYAQTEAFQAAFEASFAENFSVALKSLNYEDENGNYTKVSDVHVSYYKNKEGKLVAGFTYKYEHYNAYYETANTDEMSYVYMDGRIYAISSDYKMNIALKDLATALSYQLAESINEEMEDEGLPFEVSQELLANYLNQMVDAIVSLDDAEELTPAEGAIEGEVYSVDMAELMEYLDATLSEDEQSIVWTINYKKIAEKVSADFDEAAKVTFNDFFGALMADEDGNPDDEAMKKIATALVAFKDKSLAELIEFLEDTTDTDAVEMEEAFNDYVTEYVAPVIKENASASVYAMLFPNDEFNLKEFVYNFAPQIAEMYDIPAEVIQEFLPETEQTTILGILKDTSKVQEQKTDDKGNPVYDDDNNPVMVDTEYDAGYGNMTVKNVLTMFAGSADAVDAIFNNIATTVNALASEKMVPFFYNIAYKLEVADEIESNQEETNEYFDTIMKSNDTYKALLDALTRNRMAEASEDSHISYDECEEEAREDIRDFFFTIYEDQLEKALEKDEFSEYDDSNDQYEYQNAVFTKAMAAYQKAYDEYKDDAALDELQNESAREAAADKAFVNTYFGYFTYDSELIEYYLGTSKYSDIAEALKSAVISQNMDAYESAAMAAGTEAMNAVTQGEMTADEYATAQQTAYAKAYQESMYAQASDDLPDAYAELADILETAMYMEIETAYWTNDNIDEIATYEEFLELKKEFVEDADEIDEYVHPEFITSLTGEAKEFDFTYTDGWDTLSIALAFGEEDTTDYEAAIEQAPAYPDLTDDILFNAITQLEGDIVKISDYTTFEDVVVTCEETGEGDAKTKVYTGGTFRVREDAGTYVFYTDYVVTLMDSVTVSTYEDDTEYDLAVVYSAITYQCLTTDSEAEGFDYTKGTVNAYWEDTETIYWIVGADGEIRYTDDEEVVILPE